MKLAAHSDVDLIDVPDVIQPTFASSETSSIARPKLQTRTADGLIGHDEPALCQ